MLHSSLKACDFSSLNVAVWRTEKSNALQTGTLYLKVSMLWGSQACSGDLGRLDTRQHCSQVFLQRVMDLARRAGRSHFRGC